MNPVYYGRFDYGSKSTGRTYLTWAKKYKSGWELHSLLIPRAIAKVRKNCEFWNLDFGESWKWDKMTKAEALAKFESACSMRIAHGYTQVELGKATYGVDRTNKVAMSIGEIQNELGTSPEGEE